jgi:hypothetical protein
MEVVDIIKTILKIIFIILGIVVCSLNIIILTLYIYYKSIKKDVPVTESTTWMTSSVNRNIIFSKLNIPGSHNALTYNWCDTFNPYQIISSWWAQNQKLSIYNQLMSGCRYFDIRIYWHNKKKNWYGLHGNYINYNVTYEEALKDLNRFCKTYPGEVVVWKLNIQKSGKQFPTELHRMYLDSMLIPNIPNTVDNTSLVKMKGFNQTIDELNRKGQVILISHDSDWSDFVDDPYTEEKGSLKTPEDGIRILSDIYSKQPYRREILPILQWITVYDKKQPSSIIFPVIYHANQINKAFDGDGWKLPPSKVGDGRYGVILVDFLDEPLCRKIRTKNNLKEDIYV